MSTRPHRLSAALASALTCLLIPPAATQLKTEKVPDIRPIKVGDDIIGGAAVSGSPAGNDEVCAQAAGLDKAKDLLR
jgi:hypothetical protein